MQNLYSEDDTRVKFIDAKLYDSVGGKIKCNHRKIK